MAGLPEEDGARRTVRIVLIAAAAVFVAVLVFWNLAPFGATVMYKTDFFTSSQEVKIERPFTTSTVASEDGNGGVCQVPRLKMTTDQVIFAVSTPYETLDDVELKIEYEGDPEELLLGLLYPDEGVYSYRPIHNRILNRLSWERLESGDLALYEKEKTYESVSGFLGAIPDFAGNKDGRPGTAITTYYYSIDQPINESINVGDVNGGTRIDSTLRGPHSCYVYVKDEPLKLTFAKQELNSLDGEDPLSIIVYDGDDRVYLESVEDDGDVSANKIASEPKEITVEVPDLEEGAYRVELACNHDVLIKELASRQRYLSFEGSLFLADHMLYQVGPGKSTDLYTDSEQVEFEVWHQEALQTVVINGAQPVVLDMLGIKVDVEIETPTEPNTIAVEESSIIIRAPDGYFAFSRESLFDPFPVETREFNRYFNTINCDYIIAGYRLPEVDGNLYTQVINFDLRQFKPKGKELKFMLSAPGLKQSGKEIVIDSMEIVIRKSAGTL